jgi:hypothetical protein
VILNKCLLNNRALLSGQFSAALKSTFNEVDADFGRLDYQYLQSLATMIDNSEVEDRREI